MEVTTIPIENNMEQHSENKIYEEVQMGTMDSTLEEQERNEEGIEMGNTDHIEGSLGEEPLTNQNDQNANNQNVNNQHVENEVQNNNATQEPTETDYETDFAPYSLILIFFFMNHMLTTLFIIVDIVQHTQLTEFIKQYVNTAENKIKVLIYLIPSILLFTLRIWKLGINDFVDFRYIPESFIDLTIHLYICDCAYRYLNYFLKVITMFLFKNVLLLCKVFSMIESLFLSIRIILPTYILYNYLISYSLLNSIWMSYIVVYPLTWIYMFCRCYYLIRYLSYFFNVLTTFFTKNNIFGVFVYYFIYISIHLWFSSVPIESLDDTTCLICQDTVNKPVQLKCGHVFCEECIFKWLVQQPRCPMCRENAIPSQAFIGFNGYTRFVPTSYFF